jgi:hypothetical protein
MRAELQWLLICIALLFVIIWIANDLGWIHF